MIRVVSVNVARATLRTIDGKSVRTAIGKQPVAGPVAVRALGLAGDEQADLSVHGGRDKAVYGYPSEHYAWWRTQLPDTELPWGAFGENLTVEGLREDRVLSLIHI